MNKFDLKKYQNEEHYMVCTSEEEAEIFCNFLHKNKRRWCDGMLYTESTDFERVSGDIAYYFNIGCRQSADTISPSSDKFRLNFSDFDWEEYTDKINDITLSDFEGVINV